MFCTCVPEPAMWTELDRKWALRDGRQLGDVGGLFDAEAEPLLRDYPFVAHSFCLYSETGLDIVGL